MYALDLPRCKPWAKRRRSQRRRRRRNPRSDLKMPECEICGEEVAKVYKCKQCGVLFCANCGSSSQGLCIDCSEGEEEFSY